MQAEKLNCWKNTVEQEDKILWFDNEVFHLRMELDEAKKAKKEEALEEEKGTKDKSNTSTKQAS